MNNLNLANISKSPTSYHIYLSIFYNMKKLSFFSVFGHKRGYIRIIVIKLVCITVYREMSLNNKSLSKTNCYFSKK